jgi:hypothetical protein
LFHRSASRRARTSHAIRPDKQAVDRRLAAAALEALERRQLLAAALSINPEGYKLAVTASGVDADAVRPLHVQLTRKDGSTTTTLNLPDTDAATFTVGRPARHRVERRPAGRQLRICPRRPRRHAAAAPR